MLLLFKVFFTCLFIEFNCIRFIHFIYLINILINSYSAYRALLSEYRFSSAFRRISYRIDYFKAGAITYKISFEYFILLNWMLTHFYSMFTSQFSSNLNLYFFKFYRSFSHWVHFTLHYLIPTLIYVYSLLVLLPIKSKNSLVNYQIFLVKYVPISNLILAWWPSILNLLLLFADFATLIFTYQLGKSRCNLPIIYPFHFLYLRQVF